jgi:hypothetical protein
MAGSSARDAPGGTPDNEAVLGGAAIVVGGAVSLSGLLLYQASAAGGTHVSAVGLALAFAGVFAVERVSGRLGLSTRTRHRVAFLVVDYPGFSGAVDRPGNESTAAALRLSAAAVTRLGV